MDRLTPSTLYAGTWGGGVFLSKNSGKSWTAVNSGLTDLQILRLAIDGSDVFVGTYTKGVFKMDVSLLGVDEAVKEDQFAFYPNPARDNLHVRSINDSHSPVSIKMNKFLHLGDLTGNLAFFIQHLIL